MYIYIFDKKSHIYRYKCSYKCNRDGDGDGDGG